MADDNSIEFTVNASDAVDKLKAITSIIQQLNDAGYDMVRQINVQNDDWKKQKVVLDAAREGYERVRVVLGQVAVDGVYQVEQQKNWIDVAKKRAQTEREVAEIAAQLIDNLKAKRQGEFQQAYEFNKLKHDLEMANLADAREAYEARFRLSNNYVNMLRSEVREDQNSANMRRVMARSDAQDERNVYFNSIRFARGAASIGTGGGFSSNNIAAGITGAIGTEGMSPMAAYAMAGGIGLAVNAVGQFAGAVSQSMDAAKEFALKMSQVANASGDATIRVKDLHDRVLGLSEAFNVDRMEAANAMLSVFKNSSMDAADAAKTLTDALSLSKATGESPDTTAKALSEALKAFNLDVGDAHRVAGILNEVMQRTGVSALELSEFLGRTAANSTQFGMGIEQVASMLMALRQHGLNAEQSFTLLDQTENALLHPTKALTELFKQFGVTDGPDAVRAAGGLAEFFAKVGEATGGSAAKFAELFPNVRNMKGAANELTEVLGGVQKNMQELTHATENYEAATKRSLDSAGQHWDSFKRKVSDAVLPFGERAASALDHLVNGRGPSANEAENAAKFDQNQANAAAAKAQHLQDILNEHRADLANGGAGNMLEASLQVKFGLAGTDDDVKAHLLELKAGLQSEVKETFDAAKEKVKVLAESYKEDAENRRDAIREQTEAIREASRQRAEREKEAISEARTREEAALHESIKARVNAEKDFDERRAATSREDMAQGAYANTDYGIRREVIGFNRQRGAITAQQGIDQDIALSQTFRSAAAEEMQRAIKVGDLGFYKQQSSAVDKSIQDEIAARMSFEKSHPGTQQGAIGSLEDQRLANLRQGLDDEKTIDAFNRNIKEQRRAEEEADRKAEHELTLKYKQEEAAEELKLMRQEFIERKKEREDERAERKKEEQEDADLAENKQRVDAGIEGRASTAGKQLEALLGLKPGSFGTQAEALGAFDVASKGLVGTVRSQSFTGRTGADELEKRLAEYRNIFAAQAKQHELELKVEASKQREEEQLKDSTALLKQGAEWEETSEFYLKQKIEDTDIWIQRLQAANAELRKGGSGGKAQGYADGGSIWSPRGTDTVPAMLSPGEYVMPAKQAQMFYPQLEAMRAYSGGGSVSNVTNNTIGDVNVSVVEAETPHATANEIGRALRRELRRGTISFTQ